MNDYNLCCNVPKCRMPLNETAWVTRCMHVFCPGHGQAYFCSNPSPQITCPICNEINLRDVDILLCEMSPSDMILAGIAPEKAILLATKSMKLWWFQLQQQYCINNFKVSHLIKKNSDLKHNYNKIMNRTKQKYENEISALKNGGHSLLKKIEAISFELETTKKELLKYKSAHKSKRHGSFDKSFRSPLRQNWFDENVLQVSPEPTNHRSNAFRTSKPEVDFFN